jgi:hypothetical protein
LLLLPVFNKTGSGNPALAGVHHADLYEVLNLSEKGLSMEVYQLALKGHRKLATENKLRNSDILTIADFSQSSKNKRLYIIDLQREVLLFNTYVAHGKNTGDEFAQHFSNDPGSFQSSLGFYITKEETMGSHVGLSLILEGMEEGFNNNALKREIILHGAEYATENFIRKTGRLGRSYGCPSLPPDQVKPVVEMIKEGTCLFVYSSDPFYLSHSKLIN